MMSGRFAYCTTKSLHGIFRSFETTLWENINIKVSWNGTKYYIENAFNYENTGYWYGSAAKNWLTICFKYHYVKPFGFELGTTNLDSKIESFAFSTSNEINPQVWNNRKEYNYSFEDNGIHYFDYEGPPKRCFKLDCLSNTHDTAQNFDLRYIEMFGEMHFDISSFHIGTCRHLNVHLHFYLLFHTIFI